MNLATGCGMLYRFGDFELDIGRYELRGPDGLRHVEPLVFDLLAFLAANPGRIVGRGEMVDAVWDGRIVSDATISSCIKSARKALDDSGNSQRFIETVRGRGLRFRASVEASDGEETPAVTLPRSGPGGNPASRSEKPLIAVLPFENLSADVDEYFADGLTEDIITNLSRFRDLLVVGRSSTFGLKGSTADTAEICARLGAGYLVEGSVRRAAGRVRITAQLIDGANGVHLWADRYDRNMEDIFALQDEVTRTIAATLGVKVQDVALQRAMKKNRAELDAYDCVLRARRYTATLSAEMHADARDLLETAIVRDPSSADAHALLANVYLAEHRFDANPRPDPIGRALAMAERAVDLDPQNAYARCWLAIVHFFRKENDKFRTEADRALALNPNDPETLADIGHFYAFMGDFERGHDLSCRARALNPLHPGWYHFASVRFHFSRREYDEALVELERISMPDFYWTWIFRAAVLGAMGQTDRAGAAFRRLYELRPGVDPRAQLEKWNAAPGDLSRLLDGLRAAGWAG